MTLKTSRCSNAYYYTKYKFDTILKKNSTFFAIVWVFTKKHSSREWALCGLKVGQPDYSNSEIIATMRWMLVYSEPLHPITVS